MSENYDVDLFGNKIVRDVILREKYIEPPFSVIDGRTGRWQQRKAKWKSLGLAGELGRDVELFRITTRGLNNIVSIFDPVLCELCYKWFCPEGGKIFNPFGGESVYGIVACKLGYHYVSFDIRKEQVEADIQNAKEVLGDGEKPDYRVGDSNIALDSFDEKVDFIFSCPPYADLEVYSDIEGDISNMDYPDFLAAYRSIIRKSCDKLNDGGFACFVVGEVRDKHGNYYGFVPDTIRAFTDCGMKFYNEAIFLNVCGTAALRAEGNMKSKKLVKTHQNVLVFKKG